jgi:uncharacterized low-complexity protein
MIDLAKPPFVLTETSPHKCIDQVACTILSQSGHAGAMSDADDQADPKAGDGKCNDKSWLI